MRNDIQLQNGKVLCLEGNLPIAAIDDVADTREARVGFLDEIYDLEDRTPRCHDILNGQHVFAGTDFKSPAQFHLAIFSFGKNRAHLKHPAYLSADDDAANRRRDHQLNIGVLEVFRDFTAKEVQVLWILKHLRTLKILIAVETRSELKMPLEKGFSLTEDIENLLFWEFHGDSMVWSGWFVLRTRLLKIVRSHLMRNEADRGDLDL